MIEVYVLAALAALGYVINRESVPTKRHTSFTAHERPSMNTQYASDRVRAVQAAEARRAARLVQKVARQQHGAPGGATMHSALAGVDIPVEHFTHNNQTPFFGARVKQNVQGDAHEATLANYTGRSVLHQNKCEGPNRFEPQREGPRVCPVEPLHERVTAPLKRNNEVPVPPVRVGPGLNRGYTAEPFGGYQQPDYADFLGMRYHDVDHLRVQPKVSALPGRQGGAALPSGKPAGREQLGEMRPPAAPRTREQRPEHQHPTTGAFRRPAQHGQVVLHSVARPDEEAFMPGAAYAHGALAANTSTAAVGAPQRRPPPVEHAGLRNVSGIARAGDYGRASVAPACGVAAALAERPAPMRNVTTAIKAMLAPLQDLLQPTRKEFAVDHGRAFGNLQPTFPDKITVHDPNDVARTTIKETLVHDDRGGGIVTGAPRVVMYDPDIVARATLRETLPPAEHARNVDSGARRGAARDPDMVARTTLREGMEDARYAGAVTANMGLGYAVSDHIVPPTIRETTLHEYYGEVHAADRQRGAYADAKVQLRPTCKEDLVHHQVQGGACAENKRPISMEQYEAAAVRDDRKQHLLVRPPPAANGAKTCVGAGDAAAAAVRLASCDDDAGPRDAMGAQPALGMVPRPDADSRTRDPLKLPDHARLDPSLTQPHEPWLRVK